MAGSAFWQFSLRVYAMPGVPPACLVLQDQCGVDVNVALFLLWHGSEGRALAAAEVARVEAEIADWRAAVVVRLREVRRALKELEADPAIAALRRQVKQVELESERLQQERLFAALAGLGHGADPAMAARGNLALYAALLGSIFPASATDALVGAVLAA